MLLAEIYSDLALYEQILINIGSLSANQERSITLKPNIPDGYRIANISIVVLSYHARVTGELKGYYESDGSFYYVVHMKETTGNAAANTNVQVYLTYILDK